MADKEVCILTSVHPPFDIRIFQKEAKSLNKHGYKVLLIAQHHKEDIVDGIHLIPLPVVHNRFTRMTKTVWKLFRLALKERAKVYHFHDPELLPLGVLLKFLTPGKVIYDVHEDVSSQIQSKDWIPSCLRKVTGSTVAITEAVATKFLHRVVAATPAIAEHFMPEKTVVVSNFPLAEEIDIVSSMPYQARLPRFLYAGKITRSRGIVEVIDAIAQLPATGNIQLDLAGIIHPTSLERKLRVMPGWRHVQFHGMIPRTEVMSLAGKARAGIVTFSPIPNHTEAQPNKLFEYMAAGLPLIASNFPRWRKFLETHQCGLLVDPQNPIAIAQAMQWMLEHPEDAEAMGKRGKQAVRDKYNWEKESKRLLNLYESLV